MYIHIYEGIGLCRTEHMFFAPDRIDLMRAMILSETVEERTKFLNEMLPLQREDFLTMFKECRGRSVIYLFISLFTLY
jgi:pyruvate,orthophosphate dikinase